MLRRLRESLVAAGRLRQALLVLALAGTILNTWTAVDAQLALPNYTADAESQGRTAARVDRMLAAENHATPDPDLSSEALIQQHIRAQADRLYKEYVWPRFVSIWERAAKAEFMLLAGAVCVWLLLPRVNATRRES
jgi:hypothetical protein